MAQDTTQRKAEAVERDAAHLADQAARGTATAARRAFEEAQTTERTARGMAEAGLDTANRMARDMVERMGNVFIASTPEAQETMRRTSSNVSAVMQVNTTLSEASQAIWREWLNFTQEATRHHVDGFQRVAAARTPHDLIDAQMALLKDETELFLKSAQRITDLQSKAVRNAASCVRDAADTAEDAGRHRRVA